MRHRQRDKQRIQTQYKAQRKPTHTDIEEGKLTTERTYNAQRAQKQAKLAHHAGPRVGPHQEQRFEGDLINLLGCASCFFDDCQSTHNPRITLNN